MKAHMLANPVLPRVNLARLLSSSMVTALVLLAGIPAGYTQASPLPQATAPHITLEVEVSPDRLYSTDEEITVEVTISGAGGRVGDLPQSVRDRLPRKDLEVVLVLDRSGSMRESDYRPTRIDAAKAAAASFLQQIQPGDSTALVSFNAEVTIDAPITGERERTLTALRRIQPGGKTAVGDGLQEAIEILERGAEDTVKAIVLLSDGVSNRGSDPLRVAALARERGIPVFTVGIGTSKEEFDEATLREVAAMTGGEYLYAPDESELNRVYQRMGGKVVNVSGLDVDLELNMSSLFQDTDHSSQGLESDRDGSLTYHYDLLPVGERRTVFVRGKPVVYLPGEQVTLLASVILRYQDLSNERLEVLVLSQLGFSNCLINRPIKLSCLVESVDGGGGSDGQGQVRSAAAAGTTGRTPAFDSGGEKLRPSDRPSADSAQERRWLGSSPGGGSPGCGAGHCVSDQAALYWGGAGEGPAGPAPGQPA